MSGWKLWLWRALWPLGFLAGAVAVTVALSSDRPDSPAVLEALPILMIGWAFLGAGLVAWSRRPENRTGPLMIAVGFTFFAGQGGLVWADHAALFTIGTLLEPLYIVVFAHLLLAFPSGFLGSTLARAVIVLAYIDVVVIPFSWIFFIEPDEDICTGCPDNVLLVTPHREAVTAALNFERGLGATLSLIGIGILVHRWGKATAPERRAVTPVLVTGGIAFGFLIFSLVNDSLGEPLGDVPLWIFLVSFAVVPFAFLAGMLRGRLARGAVAGLVVEIGETPAPGKLRDALARALGDPSVSLAYWLPERTQYVDAGGRPIVLPSDGSQVATVVERQGERVAAIIHDSSLRDEPELVEAACAAAGLALENERLQADLRARLDELRLSRARIVEAADAERRKIERNLHDGAQQRLISLSLTLKLAESQVESSPDEAGRLLHDANKELGATINELRELARGIHPAILTDRGLVAALESLADRAPISVQLSANLEERLPAAVEAAVYYAVAEALTNVAKYADAPSACVILGRNDGLAVVEVRDDGVGGADPSEGTGLSGLADRIEALDGALEVVSPPGQGTVIRARIPVH